MGTQNVPFTSKHQLVVTTWNCHGLANATPYLNHLMENDTDVIALCEHWLWPFENSNNSILAIRGLENPIKAFVMMLLSPKEVVELASSGRSLLQQVP